MAGQDAREDGGPSRPAGGSGETRSLGASRSWGAVIRGPLVRGVVWALMKGTRAQRSAEPGGDGLLGGTTALGFEQMAAGVGEDGDGFAVGDQSGATAGELLSDEIVDGVGEGLRGPLEVGEGLTAVLERKQGVWRSGEAARGGGGEREFHTERIGRLR